MCGPSARSKQITALKYNPSSLPLTASNLKESNVGKIICQGSIESSRRGTSLIFFQCSCITMRINWAVICAFEVTASSVPTMMVMQREKEHFSVEGLCIWHICGAVRDNLIASSNISPAVNDYSDLLQLEPHIIVTAIIPVSNYRVVLTKLNASIRLTLKKPAGTGLQISLSLCMWEFVLAIRLVSSFSKTFVKNVIVQYNLYWWLDPIYKAR